MSNSQIFELQGSDELHAQRSTRLYVSSKQQWDLSATIIARNLCTVFEFISPSHLTTPIQSVPISHAKSCTPASQSGLTPALSTSLQQFYSAIAANVHTSFASLLVSALARQEPSHKAFHVASLYSTHTQAPTVGGSQGIHHINVTEASRIPTSLTFLPVDILEIEVPIHQADYEALLSKTRWCLRQRFYSVKYRRRALAPRMKDSHEQIIVTVVLIGLPQTQWKSMEQEYHSILVYYLQENTGM